MDRKYRVVHFLNQFFAQMGGEAMADLPLTVQKGLVGPGLAFQNALGDDYEIVATIICGDNWMAENSQEALPAVLQKIKEWKPDLLIAGPAFQAGRYGPNCGMVCKAVSESLQIPTVTGMYQENPGVELFKQSCKIVKTQNSAAGMRQAVADMSSLVHKLLMGLPTEPETDRYFASGKKKNIFVEQCGAERALDMLLAKIEGRPFHTELKMPAFETIIPAPPVTDLKTSKLAFVTDAGITDKNNTFRLESARATKYLSLDIAGMNSLSAEDFSSVHGGFDTSAANRNPNILVPLDILYRYMQEGRIGSIHPVLYSTTGNGTSLKNSQSFGAEIARKLLEQNVSAVILTST